MADVYAVFGTLLALGIAFPGMLLTLWLLFPSMATSGGTRIEQSPGRTLMIGIGGVIGLAIPVAFLTALPAGFIQFMGFLLVLAALTLASISTAGFAGVLGERINAQRSTELRQPLRFLAGAVALELAAIFPIVGWFVIIPITLVISFGASLSVLFGRTRGSQDPQLVESAAD